MEFRNTIETLTSNSEKLDSNISKVAKEASELKKDCV
jgi:hypothetical protein